MNSHWTIINIGNVFEGELRPGRIQGPAARACHAFLYLYSGSVRYVLADYTFTVEAGQLFYLAEGSSYEMQVSEHAKYICVDFRIKENDGVQRCERFKEVSSTVKNEFEKLFYLFSQNLPWQKPAMMGILYRVYTAAIQSQNRKYDKTNRLFSQIVTYILQNITDPALSVRSVAEFADVSETHLRRIFKATVNTSPIRYINFLRLEKAKNLLLNSNCSIEEIAALVGIPDPYYFSRLFKQEIGAAPSKYRSQKNRSLS